MMALPRKNRWHALLAAALLALTLSAAYLALAAPALRQRADFNARLEDIRFQHARFAAVLHDQDGLGAELDTLRLAARENSGFLAEKPAALAAADLQNHLQGLIESRGGALVSTQVLPQNDAEIFPAITVKVQMRCGIDALRRILLEIESGQQFLQVANLFLQSQYQPTTRNIRRRQLMPEEGLIEARFDVSGYFQRATEVSE